MHLERTASPVTSDDIHTCTFNYGSAYRNNAVYISMATEDINICISPNRLILLVKKVDLSYVVIDKQQL